MIVKWKTDTLTKKTKARKSNKDPLPKEKIFTSEDIDKYHITRIMASYWIITELC